MRRTLSTVAAVGAICAPATTAASPAHAATGARSGVVVRWNRFLLDLQAAPGNQPATVQPTYELAVVHSAIDDAVARASRGASGAAAADAAAHDTLLALYPGARASIDQQYGDELAQLRPDRRRSLGVLVGRAAAARVLARRSHDGSAAAPLPFQPGSAPGDYQLTPPALAQPVFTHWPLVRPFVLRRADQFRPAPPPPLRSRAYAAAIDEVQRLGVAEGSARTPDQTQIGLFWNPAIWATWNRIAQTAAVAHGDSLARDARAFAALDVSLADTVIALYDAKYAYRFWRPITAIRDADSDGNPATVADPAWTPLSNTAPDPSYPGAHGAISAAAAAALASVFGDRVAFSVDSTALPGVERSFASFSQAAGEATVSRVYNGNHTRLDQDAGVALGRDVARFVLRQAFAR